MCNYGGFAGKYKIVLRYMQLWRLWKENVRQEHVTIAILARNCEIVLQNYRGLVRICGIIVLVAVGFLVRRREIDLQIWRY